MTRMICLLIGYAFGLIQTGFLVGKRLNVDIRKKGSGSSGATNALRTLGIKAGLLTFSGDLFKCILAVLLTRLIFGIGHPDAAMLYALYTGAGVVLGHNFPFYLRFHGGKGIACMAGLAVALSLKLVPIPLAIFILLVCATRYVSLGSIAAMLSLLTEFIVFGNRGMLNIGAAHLPEAYGVMIFLVLLAIFQHRTNIRRLLNGTENKLQMKKEK